MLFIISISCTTIGYTGDIYYPKSFKSVSLFISYDTISKNTKVDLSDKFGISSKIYTNNLFYSSYLQYDNGNITLGCKNYPSIINTPLYLDVIEKYPNRILSSADSRILSIIITGSWYDNEMVTLISNFNIISYLYTNYWNATFTHRSTYDQSIIPLINC